MTAADRSPEHWDAEADAFDRSPDHGLTDPAVRAAWGALLAPRLPEPPAAVLEPGCGTGSLALLIAGLGHDVVGVDFSPRMLELARGKRTTDRARFVLGDAADPPVADGSADAVVARHILWVLPDPAAALARWVRILRPGGRLVLVEGRWWTGSGLTAAECSALVRDAGLEPDVVPLTDPALWGGAVEDERYLLTATR